MSSVEVESGVYSHSLTAEAAVVGIPDPFRGETPCLFVSVQSNHGDGHRQKLNCKAPKSVVLLPDHPKICPLGNCQESSSMSCLATLSESLARKSILGL
ncbi:hypothetical protein SUGI_0596100 [Cryptomeria japonica]|nr:hypothetical protein SUGI_0596100 [Cryptomeria japonica]